MKHVKKVKTFGSSKSQRNAALKNMAQDLLRYEYIKTTTARAKAVRAYVDAFISHAKRENVNKRNLLSRLGNEELVDKVLTTYVKRYKDVTGGYVEEYKIGFRSGDGAPIVKLMLKGYTPKTKSKLTKVKKTVGDANTSTKKSEKKAKVTAASKKTSAAKK